MYKRYVIQDLVSGLYWLGFANEFWWGESVASAWMFQEKESADNTITNYANKFDGIIVTVIEIYV